MDDVDETIHDGLGSLTAGTPDAPEWSDIERRGTARRRRRTAVIAGASVVVLFVAVAAIARVGDDDTTVVAGPTETIPCGAWIAVHTLFDSSANSKAGPNQTLATVTAEQSAFLVKSGDVPDRVARRFGGNPADLASHVVAKPNSDLGTIEITAWAGTADKARALSDAFAEELLGSVSDIQQREIDRQRGVLNDTIAQLQLELTGITGDDRGAVAQRDRLNSEVSDKQVALQELEQRAAQGGSNIYSFGSSEAFQVTADQWDALYATTTTDPEGPRTLPGREPGQRPAFDADCAAAPEGDPDGDAMTETGSSGRTYLAHAAAWDREGARLREDKRKVANSPYNAGNAGDFAYQSQPVDIDAPGTYSLLVGPLDDWWADQPSTFVVNLPTDATFWATNWTNTGVVTGADGLRYLGMDLTVEPHQIPDRPFEPYPGMTVWIY
jgi:hypothetical protein